MGKTDFLFVRPSFLNGMARVMDVFAELDDYNASNTPDEADATALLIDWQAVARDFEEAMKKALLGRQSFVSTK